MTMIAIACKGDHAEIVTDSIAYNNMCSSLKPTTKVVVLTHLDSAVATQGDSGFGSLVQATLLTANADSAECFDELVEQTPEMLRYFWDKRAETEDMTGLEGTVFLIGPTGKAGKTGRFKAFVFAHDTNFDPQPLPGMLVTPAPFKSRPHEFELVRMRAWEAQNPDPEDAALIDQWSKLRRRAAPDGLEDWAALAFDCRQRGHGSFGNILVMGKVQYLRLERGQHQAATLFEFDDKGPEFEMLMQGTNHPAALGAPCHCGSGKRLIDCHLAEGLDDPCDCDLGFKTGKSMRECCGAVVLTATPKPASGQAFDREMSPEPAPMPAYGRDGVLGHPDRHV